MNYLQGFMIPVPPENREAYRKMAIAAAPIFEEFGAGRIVEGWGVDLPRGATTDMHRAVAAKDLENVVFSWIEWDSQEACEQAHDDMMKDERMKMPPEMPFDGKRMIFAGFEVLGERGDGGQTGYVQAYVAPVPTDNHEAFADMCTTMRDVAIDSGAQRAVDGWAEDIPDGQVTDFKRSVKAEAGEAVAFGFVEWASKDAFDAGSAKMRSDDRMPQPGSEMPFDGKRLIYGGFAVLLDTNHHQDSD